LSEGPDIHTDLLELLGVDLLGPDAGFGYALTDAVFSEEIRLTYVKDGQHFEVWMKPRSNETSYFRRTSRFHIGYRGEPVDSLGLKVIDSIFERVVQREEGWVEETGWGAFDDNPHVIRGRLDIAVIRENNEEKPCRDVPSGDVIVSQDRVRGLIRRAPELGAWQVAFTGGEPTILKELPEWVALAKSLGLRVMIFTNGLNLASRACWDQYMDEDGNPCLPDLLRVSFCSARPDRLDDLSGVHGALKRKKTAIRQALGLGIEVDLDYVISKSNLEETAAFPAFVADEFPDTVHLYLSLATPPEAPSIPESTPYLNRALEESERLGIHAHGPSGFEDTSLTPCGAAKIRRHGRDGNGPYLLAPVDDPAEVDDLHEAGADILYCGLLSAPLRGRHKAWAVETANDRPAANIGSLDVLTDIVRRSHANGMKLYVAANRHYPVLAFSEMEAAVFRAVETGVDGLILSDIALIRSVRRKWDHLDIAASTYFGSHNRAGIELAGRLGLDRVVLPRAMHIDEVRRLATGDGPALEVFVARERCRFVNAYCRLEHAVPPGEGAESLDYSSVPVCVASMLDSEGGVFRMDGPDSVESCGLCAIAALKDLPRVQVFKVVGRGAPHAMKKSVIGLARRILDEDVRTSDDVKGQVRTKGVLKCSDSTCQYLGLRPSKDFISVRRKGRVTDPTIPQAPRWANGGEDLFFFLPPAIGPSRVRVSDDIAGVYLGHETCIHLLPAPKGLKAFVKHFIGEGLHTVLVLPPLFGEGEARRGMNLAKALMEAGEKRPEVVVNDLGTAHALREWFGANLDLGLGRLLVHQRLDARLGRWTETPDVDHMLSAVPRKHLQEALPLVGAGRLEFSASNHGPEFECAGPTSCSVHNGPALVSLSRACVTLARLASVEQGFSPFLIPSHCNRPCLGRMESSNLKDGGEGYLVKGNAVFVRTEPKDQPPPGTDRIVLHEFDTRTPDA